MKKVYLLITSVVAFMLMFFVYSKNNITVENTVQGRDTEQSAEIIKKKLGKKTKKLQKVDKPDMFSKYFRDITTKIGETESGYLMNYKVDEFNNAKKMSLKSATVQLDWTQRGPANVGGRTRAIIVDPDDATHATWFVGSASGGIWKTIDEGSSWSHLSEQLTNLSVNAMAMAESNHNVIFAGTGESFPGGTQMVGNGIWKTEDKGINWTQVSSTVNDSDFEYINRLVINPNDENVVLAATEKGILKSINGGASWNKVYTSNKGVEDLVNDPTDFSVIYGGENSVGVIRSLDAGETWALSSQGITSGSRFELAVSPVNSKNIFASVNVSSTVSKVYFSENGGDSWLAFNDKVAFLSTQGNYDNTIEAHPYNATEAFVAGVDMWKVDFSGDVSDSEPAVLGAYVENTTFLSFDHFSGDYLDGGMNVGEGADLLDTDWTSIEIRFGTGLSQKAHRFTVPNKGESGVPDANYSYQDYVDVPFQVWDVTNNRQLMVSFRDQEVDGAYNLYERTGDGYGELGREYIFVNAVEYNATTPSTDISKAGGHVYKNLYFFWPVLAKGTEWTPDNLPTSKIVVEYGSVKVRNGVKTSVADSYGRFGGGNRYDQGAGFGKTLIPGLHPDHHNITIIPTGDGNFTVLNGNDGGIGISKDNGVTFNMLPYSYITTQFYGVAKNPEADEYFGGMQDNGTWQSPKGEVSSDTSKYFFRLGGDGFECLWNAKNPKLMLGSIYNNSIFRSTNGGDTWGSNTSGIRDEDGPFITRLTASKEDPNLVFAVCDSGIYRSEYFGSPWTKIFITDGWSSNNTVNSSHNVEVSLANGNIVWAGAGMAEGSNIKMQVSFTAGKYFHSVSQYKNIAAYTSGIATHPSDDSTAYVLFSVKGDSKVIRTTDLGQSWEDISGFGDGDVSQNGFPDVVVHSLLVMPHDINTIWVGTDIGLFESNDNGVSWHILENGLPPVSVYDMQIVGNQVVVATHGRGIWTVNIPEIDNVPYVHEFSVVQNLDLQVVTDAKVMYDSVVLFINEERESVKEITSVGEIVFPVTVVNNGSFRASMKSYIDGVEYKSNTVILLVGITNVTFNEDNEVTLNVYPNPSNGNFQVEFLSDKRYDSKTYVQVLDLSGKTVLTKVVEANAKVSIDLTSHKSGTYLVNVFNNEFAKTQKIIVE